jgi:2-dehydro-3-deoxyphosphogluconate aldolase/(4S)-4-hydroxy-2-oxoglutarate aldolase
MPSGGVSLDNLEDWYNKGAYAVGIGSALMKNAKDGNDTVIKENTEKFGLCLFKCLVMRCT